MGLASSQCRFLQLTNRKLTIGNTCMRLGQEKTSLAAEAKKISRDYQNGNQTKMKFSRNKGVTTDDLTYNMLMRPSANNGNKPILITDFSGRVVVDDKYKEFAAKISPDGAPGGTYDEAKRTEIICALVGVTESQLETYARTYADVEEKQKAANSARDARDAVAREIYEASDDFIKDFVSAKILGFTGTDKLETNEDAQKVASAIQSALCGKNYFSSTMEEKIKNSCSNNADVITSEKDENKPTIDDFIKRVVAGALGESDITIMIDRNKKGTQVEYDAADKSYNEALEDLNIAKGLNEEVFTSEVETKIAFYDQLFTAIADLGWKNDSGIQDGDYLNEMFKNNNYYITEMTKNDFYDEKSETDNYLYSYDQDLASNYDNIYIVKDSDAANEALAEYEYKKSLINEKESRIDTRIQDLKTEQAAIQKMLDTINKVKNDNIETYFNLWG